MREVVPKAWSGLAALTLPSEPAAPASAAAATAAPADVAALRHLVNASADGTAPAPTSLEALSTDRDRQLMEEPAGFDEEEEVRDTPDPLRLRGGPSRSGRPPAGPSPRRLLPIR
ncbi:hypothetical protein HXS80_01455 [Streptomyces sp. CB04723]|uniref:hypothetical protein n=1 Tax=Streptomyces TaxID=1883 RepID=UPI0015C4C485|nr:MULTISPECIES: hypothetical protein [Streptomyces]MDW4897099.1 hypothetical protein [Streptomyces californicus]QLG30468.1 hypothetical protein HXS80_01455 [Streptomyces sp. CB04723]